MNKRNMFITLGLALGLGIGVAAGLVSKNEPNIVKAETQKIYCYCDQPWWTADDAAISVYAFGNGTNAAWPGVRMDAVAGRAGYWCTDLDTKYPSLIFVRVNGSGPVDDWGAKTADLSFPTGGDDLYTITSTSAVWGDPGVTGEWSTYVAPTNQYSVTFHLNDRGVTTNTNDNILENSLPVVRSLVYGEVFSGWYTNSTYTGDPITGVTSDCELWGKIELTNITYSFDVSRASDFNNATRYLYAWDSHGKNANWPGIELAANATSFTVPSTAKIILSNSNGSQTFDVIQSGIANDTLRVLSDKTDNKYETAWTSSLDEPAEDGYYIVGVGDVWTYAAGTKMTFNNDYSVMDTDGNIAVYFGLSLTNGDQIKVRSFIDEEDTWYGYNNGDGNYSCTKTGSYDVFFHDNHFFVFDHAERHYANVTNVFYTGATRTGTAAGTRQLITEGQNFNPVKPEISGYVAREVYTDSACSSAYVPAHEDSDLDLYIKYTKAGYYLMGSRIGWGIDTGVYTDEPGANHAVFEGVAITANDTVKIWNFGTEDWYGYSSVAGALEGKDYSGLVENDDGNIKFLVTGVYSLYLNSSDKIFIETGLNSYMTSFLSRTGAGVCDPNGIETNKATLAANWAELAGAYSALAPADQTALANADADKDSADNKEVVAARYDYIYNKYHTELSLADFMGRHSTPTNIVLKNVNNSTNATIILVVISSFVLLSVGGYFFIRKRKENN